MRQSIDTVLLAALAEGQVVPVFLAQIKFRSQTMFVWTGVGSIVWEGNTFLGVGKYGEVGSVTESSEVRADGTSVTLNGIDNEILSACMEDVQLGAPVSLWFGCFVSGTQQFIGAPYLYFSGLVDKPEIRPGRETSSITLALESRMTNHARSSNWRYTTNDQHALGYPSDIAFNWVESLNDRALLWGSK